MMRALMTKTLFVLSILLSAQALAFDADGLSYSVPLNPNDRQASVTGRASGNTATAIVIPDSATGGTYNFDYSVTAIGDNAFPSNALTSVIFDTYNMTTIGAYAFADNALTSVSIPLYVETIGTYAFANNALTSVIFDYYLSTTIGAYAFAENALTSVIIPDRVTTIGAYAFAENALTDVIFEGNHGAFISNGIFDGNPDLAVIYSCQGTTGWPQDFITGFRTITTTEINCQFEADGLNYKVTSGTTAEVTGRVSQNFATDIVIPDTVSDGTTTYTVTSISDRAFSSNYLASVTIGSSVKNIGRSAFSYNALTSVIIPASVTTIGELAFRSAGYYDEQGGGDGFTSAAFKGDFGTFHPRMFLQASNLTTITSCQGATGWPQTFGNITTTPISCSPPDAPYAPTIDSITAGDGQAIITFTPGADNGFPVTGYTAVCSGSLGFFSGTSSTSPITVSGLTNGESYVCVVLAASDAGTSPASAFSVVTPVAPPSAPQITDIVPGNEQVSISVSVADDGGSPITGYNAYCFGDRLLFGASPTSPIAVSGLTNGVSYTCAVTATNDVGESPASAFSEPVTPVAPPPGC